MRTIAERPAIIAVMAKRIVAERRFDFLRRKEIMAALYVHRRRVR